MIRRKDSMSFAEFMRGKYDPGNTEYVGRLVGNMTIAEQQMVATMSFEETWASLWGEDHMNGEYTLSQTRFNQLDRAALVANNPSTYEEPEWGFPKGRRIRGESDVECAIREFGEETNISRDSYVVLKNPEMINLTQRFTPMQRREISGIAWKTFDECAGLVRPHHVQRGAMIQELRSVVKTFETV